MTLIEFLKGKSVTERTEFAERCGTSLGHLMNVAYLVKTCGETLAISIDRESGGKVAVEEVCPAADWAYIRGSSKRSRLTTSRRCG